jgi:hypothetical protein
MLVPQPENCETDQYVNGFSSAKGNRSRRAGFPPDLYPSGANALARSPAWGAVSAGIDDRASIDVGHKERLTLAHVGKGDP